MALDEDYVNLKNDQGLLEIGIGVKEFKCIGESPPFDHPHIYLNMGSADSILCLYCNTNYVYLSHLKRHETDPAGNFFEDEKK